MFILLLLLGPGFVNGITWNVNFSHIEWTQGTQLTLQVVANPLLDPVICPSLAPHAWKLLRELVDAGASTIRYVPWFPYPKVAVVELDPPNATTKTSSWNFNDTLPQLESYLNATKGAKRVINFSTQPRWMYNNTDNFYPSNPAQTDWDYPAGNALPTTTSLLASYYGRLLSWLVKGWFVDEFGRNITGGPCLGVSDLLWEVFNEPEGCHGLTPLSYVAQYDAITQAIREAADPEHKIKFVGLALLSVDSTEWLETFLNVSNHRSNNVPLDVFSFHFYSNPSSRTDPKSWEAMIIPAVDNVAPKIQALLQIRDRVNPRVRSSLDELGTILPDDNDNSAPVPSALYYQASGAQFAYAFVRFSQMGVDVIGMSQLVGSPPIPQCSVPDAQYPSVSMFDWTTGGPNNRAKVLLLLLSNCAVGTRWVSSSVDASGGPVVVQGFIDVSGTRKLLYINGSSEPQTVSIHIVGSATPPRQVKLDPFDVRIESVR